MSNKISCFVSFSSLDANELDVRFLLSHLEQKLGAKVEFKAYFDQRSGSDLQEFMLVALNSADAILMLLTPDYKQKVDLQKPSGVLTEHKRIANRIENKNLRWFFPTIWRGTSASEAIPEYYENSNLVLDLHKFHVLENDNGERYLASRTLKALDSTFSKLIAELEQCWTEASPEYKEAVEVARPVMLPSTEFQDETPEIKNGVDDVMFMKQERAPFPVEKFSSELFVKTAAFRNINQYHKSAFTGRKGSGKTTLLKVYKYRNASRYLVPIDVEVNDWNLHDILGNLTFKTNEGDLSYVTPESKVFDFIWPVFLSLAIVRSIEESELRGELPLIGDEETAEKFESARNRYDKLFLLSVEYVKSFFQQTVDNAPVSDELVFKRYLTEALNVRNCTESLLGKRYSNLLDQLNTDPTNRKILFCLDRFDTEIQKYRKDLADRKLDDQVRREWELREIYWIQGLVEMIDHLRSPDLASMNQEFYKTFSSLVDFCVPLPRDRLFEVQSRRRDSIVGAINEEINWSPAELLTMLRKRLQKIWNVPESEIDKKKFVNARSRFEELLQLASRKMPKEVQIEIGDHRYPVETFLYVLRHTFFRPRDILIYYLDIVGSIEAARKRKKELTASAIRSIVAKQTVRIVQEEFVGEFTDTIKNIGSILQQFRFSQQVLEYEQVAARLTTIEFEMYGEKTNLGVGQKIRLLYEIGFLGVCSPKRQIGGFGSTKHQFTFVAPRLAASLEKTELAGILSYAIHPVFVEYLNLSTGNHLPIMHLSWDEIEDAEHE